MKRIVSILLIGIMVLSGLGAATVSQTTQEHMEKTQTISFSYPEIQTTEGYALVKTQNTNAWIYNDWASECWVWKLISVKNGGSIATMAYTGLDWFAEGDYNNDSIPDCTQFFKNYGVNNMTSLGQAHTQALIDYLNMFPPFAEKLDCKTVQEFVLLGDPSLQIGGYS